VRVRRRGDDPATAQPVAQQVGEQERPEVVALDGCFVPVGRPAVVGDHAAGVVRQDVDRFVRVEQVRRQLPDVVEPLEVGPELARLPPSRRPHPGHRARQAVRVAAHHYHRRRPVRRTAQRRPARHRSWRR
jgi:hypothetical protein